MSPWSSSIGSDAELTVAEAVHGGGLVADEEQAGALGLEVQQEPQQVAGEGGVQGGEGLVQHQQAGLQHEGPGQAEALGQASGPVVGPLIQGLPRELDALRGLQDGLPSLAGDPPAVDAKGFLQDLPAPEVGRQGGVGLLEDRL